MYARRVRARTQRTGAAARESLRRDRPGGLTSPVLHACGSASPFSRKLLSQLPTQVVSSHPDWPQPDGCNNGLWRQHPITTKYTCNRIVETATQRILTFLRPDKRLRAMGFVIPAWCFGVYTTHMQAWSTYKYKQKYMYACMYVNVFKHACMHACMYVCMYVCM